MPESFDLARKKMLEAIIVADAGEKRGVRTQTDGGQRRTFAIKAPDQFLSEMQGIRRTSAVPGGQNLSLRFESAFYFSATRGDGGETRFETVECLSKFMELLRRRNHGRQLRNLKRRSMAKVPPGIFLRIAPKRKGDHSAGLFLRDWRQCFNAAKTLITTFRDGEYRPTNAPPARSPTGTQTRS